MLFRSALPPATYKLISERCSLDLKSLQQTLQSRIREFRNALPNVEFRSDERSPIQIISVGDLQKTKVLADKLQAQGLAVKPIFSPTVPEGTERIRICLHAFNTEDEVSRLCQEILKFF